MKQSRPALVETTANSYSKPVDKKKVQKAEDVVLQRLAAETKLKEIQVTISDKVPL
jgi:hypothetical protein